MPYMEVDIQKCNGCADCIDACPSSVFEVVEGKAKIVNPDDCIECCACIDICEAKAITHEAC